MLLINLMEVTKGDLLRGEPDGQVEVQVGFPLYFNSMLTLFFFISLGNACPN